MLVFPIGQFFTSSRLKEFNFLLNTTQTQTAEFNLGAGCTTLKGYVYWWQDKHGYKLTALMLSV